MRRLLVFNVVRCTLGFALLCGMTAVVVGKACRPRVLLVVLILLVYTWRSHEYVQVFESNPTLWAHAVKMAPLKPRPAMNYGIELIEAGHVADGAAMLTRAGELANRPHVPVWDRAPALEALTLNIRALVVRVMGKVQ